jgi:hypothetical protein
MQRIGVKKMREKFTALANSDKWQKITQRIVTVPPLMEEMPNDLIPFNFYDEEYLQFCRQNFGMLYLFLPNF